MGFSHVVTAALLAQYVSVVCALKLETVNFKVLDLPQDDPKSITFDDSPGLGRVFEGIGAISGGGATSKLLVNYPKKQQKEILDYLFKPGFGASLQIFKVEIGGDMQSTDGTESSHMHNSWEENYNRGYEWWLMKEAKKRNPDIKLYCLPWGFPGWIGKGGNDPYVDPEQTADYVVRWIKGAQTVHNFTIDYVGIWNERKYTVAYIKALRKTLDDNGFQNTLIVAPDEFGWKLAKDIKKDKELYRMIHALGAHYPGTHSNKAAKQSKKPLWSSEDYSTFNDEVGGGCWARILNQNYVNGLMTSTISWNLIGSYYPKLPFPRNGLMTAMQPWSGHYVVSTPIWITAHTTQFVPVGWKYLKHDNGVGKLPKGGSYVSLTNKAKNELTIIIETMTHDHSICVRPKLPPYEVSPQVVNITLGGSFANVEKLYVWHSKLLFNGSESRMFIQKDPLVLKNGQARLFVGLDEVYTLTTLRNGVKGSHPKPAGPMPFPSYYKDDFSDYEEFQEPFLLAPQIGSYEVRKVGGENVMRQTVLQRPVYWCKSETADKTLSLIGNNSWTEMAVEVEFEIPAVNGTDGVFVAGRVDKGGCHSNQATGIFFFAFPITGKFIVTNDLARTKVLHTGSIPTTPGKHRMALNVAGGKAEGRYDQERTFSIDLPDTPKNGWAALGTDSYGLADFHSFTLQIPNH